MKRKTPVAATVLGLLIGTAAAWMIVSASAAPRTERLPDGDIAAPSTTMAEQTVRAARSDPRLARALRGQRWRAVSHRWHDEAPCPAARCIASLLYRYDSDTIVRVIVSPEGDLLDMGVTRGQPPISEDEQVHAHALAERDARTRTLLDGDAHVHGALAYSLYPDSGVCARHRCASVVFMLDDLATTGVGRQLHVLVDLSEDRILRRDKQRCDGACEVGW